MKLHFIHGIHPDPPGGTIANLEPYFLSYNRQIHNYGSAYAVTSRFLNPRRASKIAESVCNNDILIGHSNGCTIANMISWKQPVFGMVLINPALDCDTVFGPCEWIDVYFNPGDEAVPWSKFLWHHPWGTIGRDGYVGEFEPRLTNINGWNPPVDWLPIVNGHGALFHWPCLDSWARYIRSRIDDHIKRFAGTS